MGGSRRAVAVRFVPAGVRAADRLRPRPAGLLAPVRQRRAGPSRPVEGPGRQRTAVLEALGAGWTRLPDLPDEAYVLEADDTLLVCPWNLRVRVAEAALSARDGVPSVLADAFVPPVLAGQAKAVVEDWRSGARVLEHGVPRVHEQIATWGVPLRWFVFVDLDERELVAAAGPAGRCATARRSPRPGGGRTAALSVLRKVARRRADHRGGRGGRPVAGGVPPALDRGAGLRRPGRPAVRTTTLWRGRLARAGRRRAVRRCRAATPTPRPRRTRSWWRAGGRCSCSSAAINDKMGTDRARNASHQSEYAS